MGDNLQNLIAALERAEGGDPSLSKQVLQSLGWDWERMGCPGGGMWRKPNSEYHCGPTPVVTENAEAARNLVAEDLFVAAQERSTGSWTVSVYDHALETEGDYCDPKVTAEARTLPLALCSAALRIRLGAPAAI